LFVTEAGHHWPGLAAVGGLSQQNREPTDPIRNLKLKIKNTKPKAIFNSFQLSTLTFKLSFRPRATELIFINLK